MSNNIRRRKKETVKKNAKLIRIRRNLGMRGGNLAGVCEGLGAYFGVEPLLFRLGFIGLSFFSGFGILAYLAMAIALPDEQGNRLYPMIMEQIRGEKSVKQLEAEDWETEEYRLCEHCDTAVKYGAKFCHHCGQKL